MDRHPLRRLPLLILLFGALLPSIAFGSEGSAHADPIGAVVLYLAVILAAAKLGGDLAVRIGQPAVLGELVFGVLLGNLGALGFSGFEPIKTDPNIDMLSRLGVLVLLFEVGLESTVAQMLKVGLTSFVVAMLGVVAPFALGWLFGAWILPGASPYVHAFLGATLTATSVGITARVLQDLKESQSPEARIILGAAVIDDVLGLVILAVVTGIIGAADRGGSMSYGEIGIVFGKALVFLVGSLVVGAKVSRRLFPIASRLRARGVLLALGLAFCFLFAWIAGLIGLAPIVGAFAAGLVLEDMHFRDFTTRGESTLEHLIQPISSFLVPIFFVLMGMRTDLGAFAQPGVPLLAAALTVAAILGKQVCSLGVGKGVDRLTIGIGMVPRGEVGLIFASIGQSLTVGGKPVVDGAVFSAVVAMVIVTTMVTPPALKWSLSRRAAKAPKTPIPDAH
ncbi:cation:proton antiporter [Polyangium sp. y55x31]|uniref:cation:proton antiporter n=1 Tax=Polyangium sp. y55x31 TaxID=3042688 RepID=UPI00248277AB|nr:cation:proton antiporter [Polyangium sp. y55x31]MDI1478800.1 cation:proton antiporter [Polyangium sp. y55x31]